MRYSALVQTPMTAEERRSTERALEVVRRQQALLREHPYAFDPGEGDRLADTEGTLLALLAPPVE